MISKLEIFCGIKSIIEVLVSEVLLSYSLSNNHIIVWPTLAISP
jgi:hypothetical protein